MKHRTTLAGESVMIDHAEQIQIEGSVEELFDEVAQRVRETAPATPQAVVSEMVVALGREIPSLLLEDQLELKTVVDYPGDPAVCPESSLLAHVFVTLLSTVGSWRANRVSHIRTAP